GATPAGRRLLYGKALAMGADSAYLRGVYGDLQIGDGAVAEGVTAVRAALRVAPDYAALWFSLARGLLKGKDPAGARAALARGRTISPQADEVRELETALRVADRTR